MNWKKSRSVNKCPIVASGILLALLLCARPIVLAAEKGLSFGDWLVHRNPNKHGLIITWGYSDHDFNWKSAETLIRNTVDIASKGGNYLINAGPTADGTIPEAIRTRFLELGGWMSVYGDSMYGTQANPVGAVDWGRITAKKGRLYLHVFGWPASHDITVPCKSAAVVTAYMMADPGRAPLACSRTEEGASVALRSQYQNPYASVVVLDGAQW